jgi:hypothetical protein
VAKEAFSIKLFHVIHNISPLLWVVPRVAVSHSRAVVS